MRRTQFGSAAWVVAFAVTAWGAPWARANGRFPASTSVRFQPGDPDVTVVSTTFGLAISRDGGASFQ